MTVLKNGVTEVGMAKPIWFYQVMGAEIGPLSPAELKDKVAKGQIQPDTLVRQGVEGKWIPADRWKGLLPKPDEEELPPAPPPTVKPVHSALPNTESAETSTSPTSQSATSNTQSDANQPATNDEDEVTYHLHGDDASGPALPALKPDEYDFFRFVGFRLAVTPALYDVVVQYAHEHQLNLTQITRRALAQLVGKPELGEDKKPEASPVADAPQHASAPTITATSAPPSVVETAGS